MFYSHLTLDMRRELEALLARGINQAEIARRLQVSRSTVSRELKRNGVAGTYDAEWAHEQAMERKQRPGGVLPTYPLVIDVVFTRLVTEGCGTKSCAATFSDATFSDATFSDLPSEPRLPITRFTFPTFHWQKPKVRKPLTEEQQEQRNFYLKLRDRDHIIEYLLRGELRYYVNSRLYDARQREEARGKIEVASEIEVESQDIVTQPQSQPLAPLIIKRKKLAVCRDRIIMPAPQKSRAHFAKWRPPP